MDENLPITILREDLEEELPLLNTSILFNDAVYPNSKVTTNELDLELYSNNENNLLSTIEENYNSDTDSNISDDSTNSKSSSNKSFSLQNNKTKNMDNISNEINNHNLDNQEEIETTILKTFENAINKIDIIHNEKLNNIFNEDLDNINKNNLTTLHTIETKPLNFFEDKEDNSIYIAKINSLEQKLKEYHEKQAEKFETKYSFNRNNKINIIETYIKKYNLKYEFRREQLLELDDEEFNKIYYNIYNINESRKNSLIYYGICCGVIVLVEYLYKKVRVGSRKDLFQKFTYEIFHDNLADSFLMAETEYFPNNNKAGNPFLNITKFLLYFCIMNLIFDNPPNGLKV
jgi:hypothetical protein